MKFCMNAATTMQDLMKNTRDILGLIEFMF